MSVQQLRTLYSDFKHDVVLLLQDPSRSAAEVAENLEISKELLYQWRKEYRFSLIPVFA